MSPHSDDPPSQRRLVLELVVLFGLLPPVLAPASTVVAWLIFPGLVVLGVLSLRFLRRSGHWHEGPLWCRPSREQVIALVLQRFLPVLLVMAAGVRLLLPDRWLDLPRERPEIWAAVMVLYPALSALPQELVFRGLFFARYARVFGGGLPCVFASGLLFGWAHWIQGNWLAVALSCGGGWLLAYTYWRSGSLLLVTLEHALLGCAVFTVGLGRFFFQGRVDF